MNPFQIFFLNKIEGTLEGTSIIKIAKFGDLRKLCDIHDFCVKNSWKYAYWMVPKI